MNATPLIWLLVDDRPGTANQVLGVADALGLRREILDIRYTAAGALPNMVLGASFHGLTSGSRVNLIAPWPDLVIAAGRRTAPVARHIKEKNKGRTFLVQLMNPGDTGLDEIDLVAVPRHDGRPDRPNQMQITGAPHRITDAVLAEAKEEWSGRFASLPGPRIALIVGGDTKRRAFTPKMAGELGKMASAMAIAAGGSLLVSSSRRTREEAAAALFREIQAPSYVFRWGDEGENPYLGYLACSDAVIVTGDSVSMCSEACAQENPVYIYAPRKLVAHKHAKLHKDLYERGLARPLEGVLEKWTHPLLNAAEGIAAEIRKRMGLA